KIAGRRMVSVWNPSQCSRARPLPHRGRIQPPDAGLGDGEPGAPPDSLAAVRRALGAHEPRRLPHERREPVPDGRPRDHRRRGGTVLRPAVRGLRAPRPGGGEGADGVAQAEALSAAHPPCYLRKRSGMKTISLLVPLLMIAVAALASPPDARYEELEKRYVREFLRRHPVVSTY